MNTAKPAKRTTTRLRMQPGDSFAIGEVVITAVLPSTLMVQHEGEIRTTITLNTETS
jgi:hypothetical protein